jgi:hypothetical protein
LQALVSVADWERGASVPHEKPLVGVQAWEAAGGVPEHKEFATVVPSARVQVTAAVCVPELAVAVHEPVRLCVTRPQPVAGVQLV